MLRLGVNIDHVATLRQVRRAKFPDPLEAARLSEAAGAHGITAHLREDRRHIQDADIRRLVREVKRLNLELAITPEMLDIAAAIKPHSCCLVPEKRRELTTEGGLDVCGAERRVKRAVRRLQDAGIAVSLFIDPELSQLKAAARSGTDYIELHTGCLAGRARARKEDLKRLCRAARTAAELKLQVNAGHGIDYRNIHDILRLPCLRELNIGHSIVARSVFVGFKQAVREMLKLMQNYPEK